MDRVIAKTTHHDVSTISPASVLRTTDSHCRHSLRIYESTSVTSSALLIAWELSWIIRIDEPPEASVCLPYRPVWQRDKVVLASHLKCLSEFPWLFVLSSFSAWISVRCGWNWVATSRSATGNSSVSVGFNFVQLHFINIGVNTNLLSNCRLR